ncbi:MAG: cysteine--tRNA ligase [Patescibacteria group bacterium]
MVFATLHTTTPTMITFFTPQAFTKFKAPTLTIFNTETRTLEPFTTLYGHKVLMYSCGPTVYDYAHIGNLRAYVFVDILKRTLEYNNYTVKNTINLTDFGHLTDDGDAGEDKMMKGLKREGKPVTLAAMRELSDFFIDAFYEDLGSLRILPPTTFSRASDYISEQIALVKTLEEKGYTYETSDGLYFDISKFPPYGRLGKINLEELKSGARVEANSEKKNPADFAVWKKGELGWDSRWGKGFPGWHVECSAMAIATLGKQIDIHTGGIDHIHTHHNAEIAQSESATGKMFARYWLHTEFITIDSTKISKSLGNTITMRHLMNAGFTGDDYRYWLLTAHYRSPANFSFEALKAAKQALFRLKRHIYEEYKNISGKPAAAYISRFHTAINDDLDTPKAIALAWELIKDDAVPNDAKCATLKHFDRVLAIGLSDSIDDALFTLGVVSVDDIPEEIKQLINDREAARIARNWEESDRLRTLINLKGYTLEDGADGPKISKS